MDLQTIAKDLNAIREDGTPDYSKRIDAAEQLYHIRLQCGLEAYKPKPVFIPAEERSLVEQLTSQAQVSYPAGKRL